MLTLSISNGSKILLHMATVLLKNQQVVSAEKTQQQENQI
jgi:hypothetical protein